MLTVRTNHMYYLIKHLSIIYRWYNSEHALLQYSFASSSPGQIKQDYDIGIFNFSTNHAVLMSKSKDWLAQNQDNVSSGVSTRRLLFQRVSTTKIQFSVLVLYKTNIIIISSIFNLSSP